MDQFGEYVADFERALLALNRVAARALLEQLSAQFDPALVVDRIVTPAMEHIGAGWVSGGVALSQVYMSGRICEELLQDSLSIGRLLAPEKKLAIAVLEDHHQLGSRMVRSALHATGFEVIDYGCGISAESLADRGATDGVSILLISTLMLPAALKVKDVRRKLDELGAQVKIVVGGAPFNFDPQLWQEVGADAMGRNAAEAVAIVTKLIGENEQR